MEIPVDSIKDRKKAGVGPMFDSIAGSYDFLNHLLSFGIDRMWRKKAVRGIGGKFANPVIIDVATGTADLAITAMMLNPRKIEGVDISEKMLEIGRKKVAGKGYTGIIELTIGNSESLPFAGESFDAAMVGFGVRNFSDPAAGLTEMRRVLRKGGIIMVLEFSKPTTFPFKQVYNFYFRVLLPLVGKLFSGNRKAYRYLHDSVMHFPDNENFMTLLRDVGFREVKQKRLTFGVASIYTGIKD